MTLLINIDEKRGSELRSLLKHLVPDQKVVLASESFSLDRIHQILTWQVPEDLTRYPALKAIFSVGAGVDQFLGSDFPDDLRLIRIVAPDLTAMMCEFVTMATLGLHRDLVGYIAQQRSQIWQMAMIPPAAADRNVSVLGLGELGQAALKALQPFGFRLSGWARTFHDIEGVACYVGGSGLSSLLNKTDILINLLPLTPETEGILNADLFRQLPKGAAIVNVGRGQHLVQEDLVAALDNDHLRAAIIDVCSPEPLPKGHLLWSHEKILITPHVACVTRMRSIAPCLAANLKNFESGSPLVGEVDLTRGY